MAHVDDGELEMLLDGALHLLSPERAEEVRLYVETEEGATRLAEARALHTRSREILGSGRLVPGDIPDFGEIQARAAAAARGGTGDGVGGGSGGGAGDDDGAGSAGEAGDDDGAGSAGGAGDDGGPGPLQVIPHRPRRRGLPLLWAASVAAALGAGWLGRGVLQGPGGFQDQVAMQEMPASPAAGSAADGRELEETGPLAAEPSALASASARTPEETVAAAPPVEASTAAAAPLRDPAVASAVPVQAELGPPAVSSPDARPQPPLLRPLPERGEVAARSAAATAGAANTAAASPPAPAVASRAAPPPAVAAQEVARLREAEAVTADLAPPMAPQAGVVVAENPRTPPGDWPRGWESATPPVPGLPVLEVAREGSVTRIVQELGTAGVLELRYLDGAAGGGAVGAVDAAREPLPLDTVVSTPGGSALRVTRPGGWLELRAPVDGATLRGWAGILVR